MLRRLAVTAFGVLRLPHHPRVARGMLPTGAAALPLLAKRFGEGVDLSASFRIDEPLPPLDLAYASGPEVAPRAVDSFTLVVDARRPGFSFRNNLVLDPGQRVLTEDVIRWGSLTPSRSFLEPLTKVKGTVAYLSNTDVGNIGHWLCFTLPLVGVYRERLRVEPDFYYTGGPLRPFHVETLAMLGVRPEQIITHGVTGDRMVAAIANRRQGVVDGEMLGYVRERIATHQTRNGAARRLYVARGNVSFRRMLNEAECFALLQRKYGFEYVAMDGLPFADQVVLFSSAEFIVAPHGAALTHVLWAPAGAKVVDLMSSEWRHPMFMEIAAFVGCRYGYVVGRPAGRFSRRASREREDNLRRRADILIDPEEIDRAVAALGLRPLSPDEQRTARTT